MSDTAKREAYEKKAAAQLAAWNAEIDKLKARAKQADAELRIRYHETLGALERRKDTAQKKFEELRKSGAEAWEQMRSGVDSAWDELAGSFEKARKQLLQ